MKRSFLPSVLTGMIFTGSLTTSVLAQSAEDGAQQAVGSTGWGVQCNSVGQDLQCSALNSVVTTPGNQLVTRVSIRIGPGEDQHTITVQLPLGLNLPQGITLGVDDGEATTFLIDTCLQSGCFVAETITDNFLNTLKAGENLSILMTSNNGAQNTVQVSLAGFTAAVEKL